MITFVILHYLTAKDTIECVNSIIDNCDIEINHIVIVDNASFNDSMALIEDKYKKYSNII